jgi:hypothetical protein
LFEDAADRPGRRDVAFERYKILARERLDAHGSAPAYARGCKRLTQSIILARLIHNIKLLNFTYRWDIDNFIALAKNPPARILARERRGEERKGEEIWLFPLKVCVRRRRARFGACGVLHSVKNM